MRREAGEGSEDLEIVLVVRSKVYPVPFGDLDGHLQGVDRIEAETCTEHGSIGVYGSGIQVLQIEGGDNQRGHLRFEGGLWSAHGVRLWKLSERLRYSRVRRDFRQGWIMVGYSAGAEFPQSSVDAESRADVLVIGGGPAGATTAITLARRGHRTILVEKDRHPRFHIGESLLPMSMPILDELGVLAEVEAKGIIKRGADFPSGSSPGYQVFRFNRSLNPTWPHAVQIRRQDLDTLLIDRARAVGVQVLEATRIEGVDLGADWIRASARGADGEPLSIAARYVVDATGRDTFLGNQLRLKRRHRRHQSAALYAHFIGVRRREGEDAGNISIYRVEDGWIWVIPLPDNITSIGLVCGPDTLRGRAGDSATFLWRTLRSVPALASRLEEAELAGHLEATGNYSYECSKIAGPRWIMVGDAGLFVDPIFSSGVHFALETARRAADVVDTVLMDPAQETALHREYAHSHRQAVKRISWFIVRFNTPVMRRLFANPRNDWRLEEAIISMLAGDFYRDGGIAWRLRLFKVIYALHCLADIPGALRGLLQLRKRRREAFDSEPALPGSV